MFSMLMRTGWLETSVTAPALVTEYTFAGEPEMTSTSEVPPGTAAAASTGAPRNAVTAAAAYADTVAPEHGDTAVSVSSCMDGDVVPTKCTATPSLMSATTRATADGCVEN